MYKAAVIIGVLPYMSTEAVINVYINKQWLGQHELAHQQHRVASSIPNCN